MSLPSSRDIRIQLFILIGFAVVAVSSTTFFMEMKKPVAAAESIPPFTLLPFTLEEPQLNWDDVNLATGSMETPESLIKTARSKILHDFEAR